jgi:hypothetical protein
MHIESRIVHVVDMEDIAVATTPEDVEYVRANYLTLEALARGPIDLLGDRIGRDLPRAT